MISVEAVLFDLDGTLIDSRRDLALSVQYLQKQWKVPRSSEEEVASFVGDGVVRLIERALPKVRQSELDRAVLLFKRYYRIHCLDHTRLYPHAAETLHHFRHKKMAVVTNKPTRISKHILGSLGVLDCFGLVLGGDSMAIKKPDPFPIYHALQTLQVHPRRSAVMVGDSSNDILAGRAAGTFTCGIFSNIGDHRTLRAAHPDFEILNLNELPRLFS